jgi:hypothetical protein
MKYINGLIWFSYIIFFPFQFYESGNIQIADIFFIFGLILNYKTIVTKLNTNILLELKLFVLYTFILAFCFFIYYQDLNFFKSPLNYLYCYLVSLLILYFLNNFNFIKVTLFSITISSIIQLFLYSRLDTSEAFRISLFFNNPNQLAFYGIILNILLLLFVPISNIKYKYPLFALIFLTNSFLIFLSISQTAILIIILMIIFIFLKNIIKRFSYIFFIIIILISLFIFFFDFNSNEYQPFLNVLNRFDTEVNEGFDGDNGLEGRNYDRIIKFPEYLIFGAGESRLDRFDKNINLEIHSVFINILFSYGIIGFLFFMFFIFKIIIKLNFNNLILFFLFLLFTLPHNMLRWPLFWIITIIFYYYKKLSHEKTQIINTQKF